MAKLDTKGISKKIAPMAGKIQKNKVVGAIMGGMMAGMPVTMMGAFCSLLLNLKVGPWQSFIASTGILSALNLGVTFTTNFLAPIFVMGIAGAFAKQHKEDPIVSAILALVCFFIVTPVTATKGAYGVSYSIGMDWFGSTGIFSAIIIGLVSSKLYITITKKGWTIKMPASVPPVISNSFSSLIPGFIVMTLFMAVSTVLAATPFKSLHILVFGLVQLPLQGLGGNIVSVLVLMIICQILWWFGVHGTMVVFSVAMPIWAALDAAQLSAYSTGKPLPNIIGMQFIFTYTHLAGMMGLVILMLIAKSKQYKTLGRLAIVPAIFGITEPVTFGTPIVFNIRFFIPWVFTNTITLIIAYVLTAIGIVPRVSAVGTNNLPVLLNGLMQGSWRIAALQAVFIVLSVVIWYPFFRKADKEAYDLEQNVQPGTAVEA